MLTIEDSSLDALNGNAIAVTTGGHVVVTNTSLLNHQSSGAGLVATTGATAEMTGGSARGSGAGLLSTTGGQITADGVLARGPGAVIARDDGSFIGFQNGTIVGTHTAIWAETQGQVDISGSTARSSSANSSAARITDDGVLFITDSTLTAGGSNSVGLRADGSGGFASLQDVTLEAPDGTSIQVDEGEADIQFLNSEALVNSGFWLRVGDTGPAVADIYVNPSQISGAAFTAAGSISNLVIEDGSVWTVTGSSNLTTLENNNSLIQFSPPVPPVPVSGVPLGFKTLTVVDYSGTGGTLGLNTQLGGDGSPSDRLVIDGGSATGSTRLQITNADGLGAYTQGNGILVIDAIDGATTAGNAFSLTGPVLAGPYEYNLLRGSRDGEDPESWYLRSDLCGHLPNLAGCVGPGPVVPPEPPSICETQPSLPICRGPGPVVPPEPPSICETQPSLPICRGPGPVVPPTPPQPPEPPPPPPNHRKDVSLYAAAPGLADTYGRKLIDTLHERVGDRSPRMLGGGDSGRAVWGRLLGLNGKRKGHEHGIYGGEPAYDYDLRFAQGGIDLFAAERGGDRHYAGLYGAIGKVEGSVEHNRIFLREDAGEVEFDAYSLGGYWTYYTAASAYLDGVVQATRYRDMETEPNYPLPFRPDANTDGWGYAASLEGGYPFALNREWLAEPQAQLIYQNLDIDSFHDGASHVRYRATESLTGRLGLRLARQWGGDGRRISTVWLRPSIWREFNGKPRTEFASESGYIPFTSNLRENWWQLSAGASVQLNARTTLYGNVNYQDTFSDNNRVYEGKVGVRVEW